MTETNPTEPTEPTDPTREPVDLTKPVDAPSTDWVAPETTTSTPPAQSAQSETPPPAAYATQYNPALRQQDVAHDGFAIASLISSLSFFIGIWFISGILGIIFGHIALHNIKRDGKRGHGMALTGLIIGYVALGLSILFTIVLALLLGLAASSAHSTQATMSNSQASVRSDVRTEVAALNNLTFSGDTVSIIDEAGTHRTLSGNEVTVQFNEDYTTYVVTGEDPDYAAYTYVYDSTTGEYTASDAATRRDNRFGNDTTDGDNGTVTGYRVAASN